MDILSSVKLFFLTLPVFLIIDFAWLGFVAKKMYDAWLLPFERIIRWVPAVGVYICLVAGIVIFVVPHAKGSISTAAWMGGLFGLVSYGVYDLTNLATLSKWSPQMVLVDMIWGFVLCGVVSAISTYFAARFL